MITIANADKALKSYYLDAVSAQLDSISPFYAAIDKHSAEVYGKNMYELIDLALPKLEKQIIKHHAKIKDKKFKLKDIATDEVKTAEPEKKVVRSKAFELTPMTVEDAIEEMELVGHDFYVFLNRASGNVSVLYTRHDGDYGLIEGIR